MSAKITPVNPPFDPTVELFKNPPFTITNNYQYPVHQHQQWAPAQIQPGPMQCPRCKEGYLEEDFTACGIIAAILFFPLGIICCCLMKKKVCTYCGRSV